MKQLCGCLTTIIAIWFMFMGGCSLICKWTDKQSQSLDRKP